MEINVEETEYQIRVDSPLVPRQSTTIQSSPAQLFFARFRAIVCVSNSNLSYSF
jgi:hypothetical protein